MRLQGYHKYGERKKVEITPHLHIPILDKKKSIFNPELSRLSDFDP